MDQHIVAQRLRDSRVARLATTDAEGHPHIVPMVFAFDSGKIYSAVDHKPKRRRQLKRLSNIAANPNVAVLVDHYDDDWSRLWWVRADGVASIVATGPQWEEAVARLADKYPQYRGNPPTGDAIVIEVGRLSGWKGSDTA